MLSVFSLLILILIDPASCQIVYGCYGPPDSPCSQHTLACGDDEVIAFDDDYRPVSLIRNNKGVSCPLTNEDNCSKTCCSKNKNNKTQSLQQTDAFLTIDSEETTLANLTDVISTFNNCSNQRACTVTSPYTHHGPGYDYVRYNYICVQDSRVYNFVDERIFKKHNHVYLHFSDKQQSLGSISCLCRVRSSVEIGVASKYIHLNPASCNKVKISSGKRKLFNCTHDDTLYFSTVLFYTNDPIFIEFKDLTAMENDIMWLEFFTIGEFLEISCSGCGQKLNKDFTESRCGTSSSGSSTWFINSFPASVWVVYTLFLQISWS
ncbi:uncharacterized protein LOC126811664 [Patella vulgata]|uniref:uncharacterized protein LOC126811664 n=1 Tax=Patella vulgata TaxID=6465 RepID=UPI002180051D|nr:uncharacterized protein LOC126811664 [Patella vulgata]